MTGIGSSWTRRNAIVLMPLRAVGAALAQLADVGAAREDAPGAGEDEDLRVRFQLFAQRVQLIDHRLIDGVANLGAVQRHDDAVVGALDAQSGARHASTRSMIIAVP